ncbi:MAG: PD-(D/E)XK nuclease family protein [Gammaproteobacteria bacterium]|nr:PD-(D/E)XK nuclease family protein [Gammaproteobacteria bacterium]
MNEQTWYKSELFGSLADRKVTLVTASKRQARVWTEQYHQHAESKENVWPMPDILPIGSWLLRTYELIAQNSETPLLLNKTQSLTLWENIIRRSEVTEYLISLQATARKVQEAFQLLGDWQLPFESISAESLDHELFLHWAEEYQAQLTRNRWLDPSQLSNWIANQVNTLVDETGLNELFLAINSQAVNLKLLGFHQIPSAQQALLETYCDCFSGSLEKLSAKPVDASQASNVQFFVAQDFEHEIRSAAEWALEKITRTDSNESSSRGNSTSKELPSEQIALTESQRRIAIVIPGLEQRRYEVEQILMTQLHPEYLTSAFQSKKLYNISVGTSLREYPIIRIALDLIKLLKQPISRHELAEILVSDSIGLWQKILHSHQQSALKRLAFNLPELGDKKLSLIQVIRFIETQLKLDSDEVSNFDKIIELHDSLPERDTFDGWSRVFIKWLEIWEWFRGQTLSSYDFQLREQFVQVIHSLRQFNTLFETVRIEQVIKLLNQTIEGEVFQAKSLGEPIAVMGLYEAIGLEFDAVWFSGLSNEVLPEPPQMNPFIPMTIAQEFDIPGSSPERELNYAKQLLKQLRGISHDIRLSYFKYDGDRHLSPSPLLNSFSTDEQTLTLPTLNKPYAAINWMELSPLAQRFKVEQLDFEAFNDETGLSYNETILKSGNQFLTAQSKCPMQGYLAHRVNLLEQESPTKGIDPRDRGVFVHKVMQKLWLKLKSHSQLIGTPEQELVAIIKSALNDSLDSNINQYSLLAELEKNRYFELIYQLLQQEKKRESFVVEHLEFDQTILLNGLSIKTRLDRMDYIDDVSITSNESAHFEKGKTSRVLIDYKTGKVNQNLWFHERLGEPQLPLYLLSDKHNIKALCFAQLHHEEAKFVGVSATENQLPKVKSIEKSKDFDDWATFVDHLETKLLELADEIKLGVATVTPEQKLKACDYCAFDSVCRVDELSRNASEVGESD